MLPRPHSCRGERYLRLVPGKGLLVVRRVRLWRVRNLRGHRPVAEVNNLLAFFHDVASEGSPEEALASFYTYESQVPRVAVEKARGLREMYGADEKTCGYFTLHSTADVYHSQIWRQQLARRREQNPQAAEPALAAAEPELRQDWERQHPDSAWDRVVDKLRDAWESMTPTPAR